MKLHVPALACMLMLFPAGCSAEEPQPQTPEIITFKALPMPDLFVDIPENYQVTSSDAYKEYYVCDDASIIITEDMRAPSYPSSYDYSIQALKEYQNLTDTVHVISSEALPAPEGSDLQTLEFEYALSEGQNLTAMTAYLTDQRTMYIITCKSSSETYETHKQEFLSVIQSARIARGD